MPLPAKVKKKEQGIWLLEDGRYLVDVRGTDEKGKKRRGRGIRETYGEAKRLKAKTIAVPKKNNTDKDTRRLKELVETWDKFKGKKLFDGKKRKANLLKQCESLGNPIASTMTTDDYQNYLDNRKNKNAYTKNYNQSVCDNTLNHDLAYMRAMFNTLIKLGKWKFENPIQGIEAIAMKQSEITFLSDEQIITLWNVIEGWDKKDTAIITKICLATGSRWSEAETLRPEQIQGDAIHFAKTKNSKARLVPIDRVLKAEILTFKQPTGRLFKNSYSDFRKVIEATEIKLPKGQLSHVLRHSFAVKFMRNRGNILDLQKILGHKTLQMTLRYAQYHPDYLADAPLLNPIADLLKEVA